MKSVIYDVYIDLTTTITCTGGYLFIQVPTLVGICSMMIFLDLWSYYINPSKDLFICYSILLDHEVESFIELFTDDTVVFRSLLWFTINYVAQMGLGEFP